MEALRLRVGVRPDVCAGPTLEEVTERPVGQMVFLVKLCIDVAAW